MSKNQTAARRWPTHWNTDCEIGRGIEIVIQNLLFIIHFFARETPARMLVHKKVYTARRKK